MTDLHSQKFTLYIGNKNYSSWSMRAWIMLKILEIDFEEIMIPLYQSDSKDKILNVSPSGKLPCLHHKDNVIWDTMAITEYLNEIYDQKLYPQDSFLRNIARSSIAEMHSGFLDLRCECTMNIRKRTKKTLSEKAEKDLKRIYEIWDSCKKYSKSKTFLFGEFGVVDAFFAPVVSRIVGCGLDRGGHDDYINLVLNNKIVKEWIESAMKETIIIDKFE